MSDFVHLFEWIKKLLGYTDGEHIISSVYSLGAQHLHNLGAEGGIANIYTVVGDVFGIASTLAQLVEDPGEFAGDTVLALLDSISSIITGAIPAVAEIYFTNLGFTKVT